MKNVNITSNWTIVKSDFLDIEEKQDDSFLIEDLFQIRYLNYVIDAGWYKGLNAFVIYLILDSNWDDPIVRIKSNNLQSCFDAIQFVIEYTDKHLVK